ncbi:MAG: hypothetical protein ACLPVF_14995 [Acidimicrobiales bacterium]
MAYLITHFYEGGTPAQYQALLDAVHPAGGLPRGQTYHAAGPTEGGWLIAAVWDSKDSFDRFLSETLMPALGNVSGGFAGPPEERKAEVANLVKA